MSTPRQQRLADEIVQNLTSEEPKTATELLESAGYSSRTAIGSQKRTIEQEGVQQELIKRGFNPETAKEVVGEILIGGENDSVKLKAADMVLKVHGEYAPEKHVNMNLNADLTERETELRQVLIELLSE